MLNYGDDHYGQGYAQMKGAFGALTKDDILQPYMPDHDFRSSNNDHDIVYNLYVFDIRYQKNLETAQQIGVKFKFSENNHTGIYGYP